jgi:hypothetical protein
MRFRTQIIAGKEVLFVGHEKGNSKPLEAWNSTSGRWKIDIKALDYALSKHLGSRSFGGAIECFIFFFEIADFNPLDSSFFVYPRQVCRYFRKRHEVASSGGLVWSSVNDLPSPAQLEMLIECIRESILNLKNHRGIPKDFDYSQLAFEVVHFLRSSPLASFEAKHAA